MGICFNSTLFTETTIDVFPVYCCWSHLLDSFDRFGIYATNKDLLLVFLLAESRLVQKEKVAYFPVSNN